MTTITDARAREFWCAVYLQSLANNPDPMDDKRLANAMDEADVSLFYFAERFGDRALRDAVEELSQ